MAATPPGFRYLRKAPGRPPAETLEANYRPEELRGKAVVRDCAARRYHVFETWGAFWSWRDAAPEHARCYDEVVLGAHPQRLKFDIDAPASAVEAVEAVEAPGAPGPDGRPDAKMDAIMEIILDTIVDELHGAYFCRDGVCATRADLAVTDASGATRAGWKYSYHVLVVPYAVANSEEAKGFTARVLGRLPAGVRPLVDPQVNKTLQNFRLTGSAKPGSRRVKRLTPRYGTGVPPREETVVGAPPGARVLGRLHTEDGPRGALRLVERPPPPPLEGGPLAAVLAGAAPALGGHAFLRAHGRLLTFRRTRPSHCALCGRTHDRDNTLMLVVRPADEGRPALAGAPPRPEGAPAPHEVVEYCRRAPRGRSRLVCEVAIPPLPEAPEAPARKGKGAGGEAAKAAEAAKTLAAVGRRIAAIRAGEVDPHLANATEFERLPPGRKNVYSEPVMRDFEVSAAARTLAVKAQCKMGKTTRLRRLIDALHPPGAAPLRPPVIRFVTFRQTFSRSVQREHFPDFELYSAHKGDLDHLRFPRLIVQVESLHRLPMPEAPEPPDMLILDEVESILDQFNSGLHRHFNAAFAMFRWLLRAARRVVVMDANLGDRTLNVLRRMRPEAPPFFHWNRFRRAAGDSYRFTTDQAVWLDHLFARLGAGERLVVPTSSLREGELLEAEVAKRFPGKAVRLYSSKTPQSVKDAHFADVARHWSALDVLIYTPTVSAGVSYEAHHFDALFGYFVSTSCDVETCRQMLARVRSLRTREHVVCLAGPRNNLPTEVAVLRRRVRDRRTNLYRRLTDAGAQLALQFDYGDDGEIRYHESAYFSLWLETVCRANRSKNAFAERFIDQVADSGAAVAALGPLPGAEGRRAGIRAGHRGLKEALAAAEHAALAGARVLSPDEAEAVSEALRQQRDVAPGDRLGLLRFRLADAYAWHGRPMGAAFVAAYNGRGARAVYRNLRRISEGVSVVASLEAIQRRERLGHRALMGGGGDAAESRDLRRDYRFGAHFLAISLLRLCGFRCITDPASIRLEALCASIRAGERGFIGQLEAIQHEFAFRRPSVRSIVGETDPALYVRKALGVINPVERMMYGIEVARSGDSFFIRWSKIGRLFAYRSGPVPDDAPGGAKPHIPSNLRPLSRDGLAPLAEDICPSDGAPVPSDGAPVPSDGGLVPSDGAPVEGDPGGTLGDEELISLVEDLFGPDEPPDSPGAASA